MSWGKSAEAPMARSVDSSYFGTMTGECETKCETNWLSDMRMQRPLYSESEPLESRY